MGTRFALTDYVEGALSGAAYDKLEDGTFAGRIPDCKGVVAFGATLRECQDELRSTLEDWILLGLRIGHRLPVIGGIDLNQEPQRRAGCDRVGAPSSSGGLGNLASRDSFQARAINS